MKLDSMRIVVAESRNIKNKKLIFSNVDENIRSKRTSLGS